MIRLYQCKASPSQERPTAAPAETVDIGLALIIFNWPINNILLFVVFWHDRLAENIQHQTIHSSVSHEVEQDVQ
ncbi:hypothetical protein GZ78_09710 [Endozoicomonas numazuensis]|uniref:Uncharacterized protein n=1 Tax=Endozoicomonas numazuensis TaxID=1137799 RepID=A0A081NHH9_9GAMM|nr:hypothetical protein GZ78_09710 [Endozoicomonas numazuensis]